MVLGLLVLDSWSDHRALKSLVQDAYDAAMLESVNALRAGLVLAPDGDLRLNSPLPAPTASGPHAPRRKYFHVGLTPRGAPHQAERVLLGETDLPAPPAAPGADAPASVWYDGVYRGQPVRMVALRSQVIGGGGQPFDLLIQAAESTELRDQVQAESSRQALLRDARMLAVLVVLVWLGVNWSLRPLGSLRESVQQRRNEDLQPLAAADVPHEVAPLVDAVNLHVARYRDLLDAQAQFLADASHQLRTPLAIMLTQAGVALREKDPQLLRETLLAIVAQIARSRRLCEQLLSLAHASDSSAPADTPGLVSLSAIAKDVVLQYLALAHEKHLDLGWVEGSDGAAAPTGLLVRASGPELYEALANLVHNAIVHAPPGGHITVTACAQAGMARVEVLDDGPGIPATRREAVFERFRQGGARPDQAAHGAGLGLAIARAYARRNGGDIALADAADPLAHPGASAPGLRAILQLPLASGQ